MNSTGQTKPQPGDLSDEQLMRRLQGGDRAAIAVLVERYHVELFQFLARFLQDASAADDVFQETFIQVFQSASSFDPTRRFKPWLFTIAANKGRDWLRTSSRRAASPLDSTIDGIDDGSRRYVDLLESAERAPAERLADAEEAERVRRIVAGMPEALREALLLSYFQGFAYKEIAEILGVPLGTVKSRLHAAVAHFAGRWKRANRPGGKS